MQGKPNLEVDLKEPTYLPSHLLRYLLRTASQSIPNFNPSRAGLKKQLRENPLSLVLPPCVHKYLKDLESGIDLPRHDLGT